MSTPREGTGAMTGRLRLPQEWGESSLGELFEVQQGKALSPNARQGKSPRPFLRTANVLWGRLDLAKLDRMDFDPTEAERLAMQDRDLLVCEGGEIGRTAIWRCEVPDCLYQNHIHRLRRKGVDVDPGFVMYWMQAAFLSLRLFGGAGNNTTIPNLSAARLKTLFVPKPSPSEQQAIARVLARIQRAVELEDRRIATLKELKAATMAKVFREGLRGRPLKQTEIGMTPDSWEVVPLGLGIRTAQYGLSLRGQSTGRVPILRMNCQHDGRVAFRDLQYVQLDERSLRHFRLQDGDLLFNRTNSFELVGRTALFTGNREAVFASYLIRLQVDPDMFIPAFLNHYLNLERVQQAIKSLATRGVSQSNISASKLRTFYVPKPPLPEQREIAETIDTLAISLGACQQRREVRAQLFQSTLQQLMTGQLRVTPLFGQEEATHA